MGPGIPVLFDHRMHKQIIPNLDSWFQSKTGQRYSYRTMCDMAAAFASGLNCSYRAEDIALACAQACRASVKHILQSDMTNEYRRAYWIEILDPLKLPSKAQSIRDNFDNLRKWLGDDILHNYLCRVWKVCQLQNPSEGAVFERLVTRMGRQAIDPEYPDTVELDRKLCERVIGSILRKDIPQCRNVSNEIIRNVDDIQSGKL